MIEKEKRSESRAPLEGRLIGAIEKKVFTGKTLNIGPSSLLISEDVQALDVDQNVSIMFEIPLLKDLSVMKMEKLMVLTRDDFQKTILRLNACVARKFQGKNPIGENMVDQIALKFVDPSIEIVEFIHKYVTKFKKNLELLLREIESLGSDNRDVHKLRKMSQLLGYGEVQKLSILRQRVTHHYQSL